MNDRPAGDLHPPIVLAHARPFRIGPVEVWPATREVIGPEAREIIEPRIMQVLVALHDARGEIVSRDDLTMSCWEGRVVGDDAINRAISRIRKLGETVGAGAFKVETITKVGYRLVTADGAAAGAAPPAESGARPGMTRRGWIAGAGATAAIGAGAGFWLWPRGGVSSQGSPEAREHYDRGLRMMSGTIDWNQVANAFQRAADADPGFADAWGHLAMALEVSRFFQPPEAADLVDRPAREAVRRALDLDPRNSAALTAQALASPLYGDWLTPETRLREALASDPRNFIARDFLSRTLENVGRAREALAMLETYPEMFAGSPGVQYRLTMLLWQVGRLADAERVIDAALRKWPTDYPVWFSRYWLFVRTGRPQQALHMNIGRPRPPGIEEWNFELNDLNARAVLTRASEEVQRAVAGNRMAAQRGAGFCENGIHLAGQLGLIDEAFALAEAYYLGRGFRVAASRFSGSTNVFTPPYRRLTGLLFAPTTAAMRRDPRFGQLMEETGLASYWRRSGTRADVLA